MLYNQGQFTKLQEAYKIGLAQAVKSKPNKYVWVKHKTVEEIAEKMFLSPRTIDNYRDALFQKIDVNSRVGLVLFALKHGVVNLH